ncbi:MAG TPA: ATP-binding protein, partial [Pirellulales bacterium]|nr:ATP-binding protein [Pirellulales bacterium]
FPLWQLVHEEVRQLSPLAAQKGLPLVVPPSKDEVRVRTDRVKLARILGNLIGNALKFTDQGEIRIEVELLPSQERRLLIRVIDTGMGIEAKHLESIFDEFAQIHNPARDRNKGSGLGLAICKRLLDVMGGTIEVASEAGRGSVFTVALPASCVVSTSISTEGPVPAVVPSAARATSATPLGLKLLLVEDHASTREGTAMLLRQEGATVVEAPDGQTALSKLSQEHFDAVLIDMMLPDLDGADVIRAIRGNDGRHARLPVFVLTGDLTQSRLAEVAALEVAALIEKPIDIADLVERLRATVRG